MSTTDNQQKSVSNVNLDSIDDFLPMPGAESVVTADDSEGAKPGFFTKDKNVDLGFLDDAGSEGDGKPKPNSAETQAAISELDTELENTDDADAKSKAGRKKIDKSGLVETFSKLFDDGVLVPFEDDKPMEEYSVKDWQDLISANLEEKEKALREQTPKEFFESLPQELQYAAEYVAKGGTDVGTTSSFVLPMVGAMTIITTFITPYLIKIGWKLADRASTKGRGFSIRLRRNKKY